MSTVLTPPPPVPHRGRQYRHCRRPAPPTRRRSRQSRAVGPDSRHGDRGRRRSACGRRQQATGGVDRRHAGGEDHGCLRRAARAAWSFTSWKISSRLTISALPSARTRRSAFCPGKSGCRTCRSSPGRSCRTASYRPNRSPRSSRTWPSKCSSESNTRREMERKRKDYFTAGVRLVWQIDPDKRSAEVFTAPDNPTAVGPDGELDGADVLPGFKLSLKRLFERAGRRRGS